ncbi:hypothetical protein NE237_030827 [Protea cynaroides]|uniref:Uncharacterized protein n=1 Tax=Protea cynaroides TaxID=273540 RepID=A0A9Q0GWW9_9MAGN|nr:hypothetical protein NE237_030827 [Protea cynaroides]
MKDRDTSATLVPILTLQHASAILVPILTLQHARNIEDPNGAFFTVPAKNKNDEILGWIPSHKPGVGKIEPLHITVVGNDDSIQLQPNKVVAVGATLAVDCETSGRLWFFCTYVEIHVVSIPSKYGSYTPISLSPNSIGDTTIQHQHHHDLLL